jgi:hypothetical protein
VCACLGGSEAPCSGRARGEHAARTACRRCPCATCVRPAQGAQQRFKARGRRACRPSPARRSADLALTAAPSSAGLQRGRARARQVTRLDFLPEHAASYNELVEVVERNLLLADWRDENHEESMLHVRNAVWGAQMLQNLRRAASGSCLGQPWVSEPLLRQTRGGPSYRRARAPLRVRGAQRKHASCRQQPHAGSLA